ncbi:hypothetical protein Hs30E_10420 [Lactococcus hodotermopsidis]|uniref:Type IV secretion system coupling protein TraD DNA-binding domain-containing protein n=1 Tax=Pseudolactococcus hodotermopsidis TaxID=2709157 RepID=A0A6A0BDQ4_9LACT|nr:TraM recognition domain-containing protein [Lactococcus hodotermopsidis]GFH42491.1 hypothetical protein Hs30E_10420 [Lactococcus hodotermopsidis]
MGRIVDSLFKSKDAYLRGEIDARNKRNLPAMPKVVIDSFCSQYYTEMHNTIISGGMIENRAIVEYALIKQAQQLGLPVVILHSGNRFMKSGVGLASSIGSICYYDPIVGKDSDEIADILTDLASNLLQGKNDLFGLWSLVVDVLSLQGEPVTLERLVKFRCDRIPEVLGEMAEKNSISNAKRIDYTNRFGSVSACAHEAQRLLTKLKSYPLYTEGATPHSLEDVLNEGGIASIDIVSDTNDVLKELCFTDIDRIMKLGRNFLLIVEGVSFLKRESHVDNVLLRNSGNMSLLFAANDVPAMTQESDEHFQTLVSGHTNVMILKHNSAASAKKWSDYLGQHYIQQVEQSIGTSKENLSLIKKTNTSNITVREERRDIVPTESITRLLDYQSYVLEATERQILKVALQQV